MDSHALGALSHYWQTGRAPSTGAIVGAPTGVSPFIPAAEDGAPKGVKMSLPGGKRHLVAYLLVLVLTLVLSGSIQQAWNETVDHLLGTETGWDRIGMHWGFVFLTVLAFLGAGYWLITIVIEERSKQNQAKQAAVVGDAEASGRVHAQPWQQTALKRGGPQEGADARTLLPMQPLQQRTRRRVSDRQLTADLSVSMPGLLTQLSRARQTQGRPMARSSVRPPAQQQGAWSA